jgi:hypothetical protein
MDERPRRFDPATGQYVYLQPWELQHIIPDYDIPESIAAGWRKGNEGRSYFGPDGMSRYQNRGREYIVTRPEGYVPYQSVVQPNGRYAYNPNQHQYPRTRSEELGSGGMALLPQARQYEFMVNRSDHYVHQPGEVVEMGINYDQMRTAPVPQPQQPIMDQYGRPVVQGPIYGSMGAPPLPHMYGGYGGGQR